MSKHVLTTADFEQALEEFHKEVLEAVAQGQGLYAVQMSALLEDDAEDGQATHIASSVAVGPSRVAMNAIRTFAESLSSLHDRIIKDANEEGEEFSAETSARIIELANEAVKLIKQHVGTGTN